MKRFLVVASQGGGCDYTIGCGIATWMEEAESMENLVARIEKAFLADDDDDDNYDENYSGRLPTGYESGYDSLEIYEIAGYKAVDTQTLVRDFKALQIKRKEEHKLAKELAQYESLKKKFG